jgi:D-3-phosphoglycerate dehydrogenase
MYGRTLGIVGLGTIGSKVAKIATESFNMDVVAYDPYVEGARDSDIYPRIDREKIESYGVELVDYDIVFKRASIVTMHVPLTHETESMVGSEEFEALDGGYFLNLSRGEVVNETELVDAVDRGLLKGVALDVMGEEPPNPSNPLLHAQNVYITPHIAGGKEGYPSRSAEINAKRISKVLSGGVPDGLINPQIVPEHSQE